MRFGFCFLWGAAALFSGCSSGGGGQTSPGSGGLAGSAGSGGGAAAVEGSGAAPAGGSGAAAAGGSGAGAGAAGSGAGASGGSAGNAGNAGSAGSAGQGGESAGDAAAGSCEGFPLSDACQACLATSCCETGGTCKATPMCFDVFGCLRACSPGNASCWVGCFNQYPSGAAQGASAALDGCLAQHCPSCTLM